MYFQLPVELVEVLTADTELLKQVTETDILTKSGPHGGFTLTFAQLLLSHVVPGALMSGDISDDMTTESAEGGQLRANIYLKSDFYDVSTKDRISAVQESIPGFYDHQWEEGEEGRHQGGQWCHSHDD